MRVFLLVTSQSHGRLPYYICNAGLGAHLMCIAEAPAGRDSVRRDLQNDAPLSI